MQIEEKSGIQKACEDHPCRLLQSISSESSSNQRVIMRPDRSIVIRHRVIARFAAGHRADSPPRERRFACERCHYTARVFVSCDTSEQTVACIRATHAASLLVSIQRKRVCGKLVAPKCFLEPASERFRLFRQLS